MKFAPELIIEQHTRERLAHFVNQPSQSLLLTGQVGVGLHTIARAIGKAIYPLGDMEEITPIDSKEITIEQVRQLQRDTKTLRQNGQFVVIDDCSHMSLPAQNALLKLIEEPPTDTIFILTSHDVERVLETIRSRVASIEIRPVSQDESKSLLATLGVTDQVQQLLFIAAGLPAELSRLASDPAKLDQIVSIYTDARKFLQSGRYDKLSIVQKFVTRDDALTFLNAVARLLIHTQSKQDIVSPHRYHQISDSIERLHENANVKLQMMRVAIEL